MSIGYNTQTIRGLTEENTRLGIISPIGYFKSPIGYFKSPIGDILSIWGLVICSLTLRYQTHISPIPNWICYAQLRISDPQLGIIFTNGDNILNWGYCLLVLYSSSVMAPTILTSAICDFLMGILVSLLGLFGTSYYQHTTPPHKVIYHTSTPRNLLHTHTGYSSFIKGI